MAYNFLADVPVAEDLRSGTTFKSAWARSLWGSEAGALSLFLSRSYPPSSGNLDPLEVTLRYAPGATGITSAGGGYGVTYHAMLPSFELVCRSTWVGRR